MSESMQKETSPSLMVSLAGVEFRSPIGVAAISRPWGKALSMAPEVHAEVLLKHAKAGAGYIYIVNCGLVTKSALCKLQETARSEKIPPLGGMGRRFMKASATVAPYGFEGLYMIASPFWITPESVNRTGSANEEITRILKKKKPEDVRLIANVVGLGDFTDTYVDAAKKWEQLGVDLIQLNLACPFPTTMRGAVDDFFQKRFPARFQGALIGDNPDIVEKITREVVKAVSIPVGVKISPETGFPRVIGLAKRIRDAGAKWIESTNAAVGIAPPDIFNRGKPLWPFINGNPFCQLSGSWLRPQCYKYVAAIAKFVPDVDIAASGGLMTPEHCVEVMMLGARLAQLCTGVIEQGRNLIRHSNRFIEKYMVEQGYRSVDEFIGLGQQYIKYSEEIELMKRTVVARLDETRCTRCGACLNNICTAIYSDHGSIKIRVERCEGCGGCILACQLDAIKLVPED